MLSNDDIKYFASLKFKKYRQTENKFLIEGVHLIEECLNSDYSVECIIASDRAPEEIHSTLVHSADKKKIPIYALKVSKFSKLTETKNSQGIVAVVQKKPSEEISEVSQSRLIVALDRINDPGNLGTIIRTAYWFGADAVVTGAGSVDIYNSKVLRSSQGAVFHISLYENIELGRFLTGLAEKGHAVFLLDARGDRAVSEMVAGGKIVFVFGNESGGISREIADKGFPKLRIEGYSGCESLNVAVGCGIVLYEHTRHR